MMKKLTKTMVAPGGESSTNLITSISLTWMIRTTVIVVDMNSDGDIYLQKQKNPLSGFSVASMLCL